MPQPDTPPADDTVQDDPIDVNKSGVAPSLDQVHQMNQRHVENEDEDAAAAAEEDADADAGDDDDSDSDAGDADDADAGDDQDDADADAGDADDADAADDADDTPPAPVTPEPVKPADEPATPDTDITKNGAGKVAIKDADGNTFYFNNLNEVPDDFEPANYKSLMVGTKALLVKEQKDEKAAEDAKVSEAQAAHVKATEDMQNSWEADATSMVRAGVLPNEPKKLEAAKNEVYDYIESELALYNKTGGKEGSVQTSFSSAYKNMMYDKAEVEAADKQKEINDAKKKRGSIVQGGSGADAGNSSGGTRGNKVIEAPPAGVGLDAVHNRAINSL